MGEPPALKSIWNQIWALFEPYLNATVWAAALQ